jgi:hypothetical protein
MPSQGTDRIEVGALVMVGKEEGGGFLGKV